MIRVLIAASASFLVLAACQRQSGAPVEKTEAAALEPVVAGQTAPAFTLVDAEGVPRSLADFRGKTVVLEWTNEGCPYVQKHYSGAMQALQREAVADGVIWLTIISSAPGTQGHVEGAEARAWKAKHEAAFTHLLLDADGTAGRLYDARTTPDMRVIDPQGRLVYVGGIDDRPTNKVEDLRDASNFVRAALDDLEAGRPVRTPFAQPYGCSIKYVGAA